MRTVSNVNLFRSSAIMQTHNINAYWDYVGNEGPAVVRRFDSAAYCRCRIFLAGPMPRKRTRTLLEMTDQDQQSGDSNPNMDKHKTRRRRDSPKISFVDKLIDKALLLDNSSSNIESSISTTSIVLAIIVTSLVILPNTASQLWFIGLFGLFSFLSVDQNPSRLLTHDEVEDLTTEADRNVPVEDNEGEEFNIYSLGFAYFAALSLAGILAPLDFEMEGATSSLALSSLPTGVLIAVLVLGLISASDLLPIRYTPSFFFKRQSEVNVDRDTVPMSAEEKLMDLWDQEFEREQKREPDGRDN
mmetsp:Transcript_5789/g.16518  ORF Transcript_5789/g.16518 Transcript_5789/m.16518 type:complete len:301 (+) Transcript_5789:120-1022(+)